MFIAHAQDDGWMDQEYFFSSRCKRSTLTVMASTSDSLPLVGSYTSKHLLLDVFTKMKIFRYWRIDRVIQSVIFTLCPKGTGTLHYSARLSKTRWFPLLPTFPSSSLSQVAVGKKIWKMLTMLTTLKMSRIVEIAPLHLTARCLRKKSGSPSGLACSMQSFWPWPIFAGWLGPMQFWSENHQVGWHAAEYLIGDQTTFYHSSIFLSSHLGAAKLWINTQCDRVSIFKSTRIGFNSFSRRSQWRGTRQGGCRTSS